VRTLIYLGARGINPLKRVTRRSRNEGSWLADSQMHKVGYPNLNVTYSEEDSRDAADVHETVEVGLYCPPQRSWQWRINGSLHTCFLFR